MRTIRLGSAKIIAAMTTAVMTVAALIAAGPTIAPSQASTADVTIVAVGDIAKYVNGAQTKTAALTVALKPSHVLLLGDLAYMYGQRADFKSKFDPSWGKLVAATIPTIAVPGNHEYSKSAVADGYRAAANTYRFPITARSGELADLWSSTRIGAWTIIGLDSEGLTSSTASNRLNAKGTREVAFLKAQLAANNGRPTIVMWHRPRFSTGPHGNQTDIGVTSLWKVSSADIDVKVALFGHDHIFEPVQRSIAATSSVPAHTVLTMTVGTGGADLYKCSGVHCIKNSYGVAKLTLHATSLDWKFIAVSNTAMTGKVLKSGTTN